MYLAAELPCVGGDAGFIVQAGNAVMWWPATRDGEASVSLLASKWGTTTIVGGTTTAATVQLTLTSDAGKTSDAQIASGLASHDGWLPFYAVFPVVTSGTFAAMSADGATLASGRFGPQETCLPDGCGVVPTDDVLLAENAEGQPPWELRAAGNEIQMSTNGDVLARADMSAGTASAIDPPGGNTTVTFGTAPTGSALVLIHAKGFGWVWPNTTRLADGTIVFWREALPRSTGVVAFDSRCRPIASFPVADGTPEAMPDPQVCLNSDGSSS
jgi:hypothetical protein